MDRFGLHGFGLPGFEERVDTVAKLCQRGLANRVVLSHDAGCIFDHAPEELLSAVPQWNYRTVITEVLPALRERGVSQQQIDQMTIGNPRAIFEQGGAY